MTMKKRIKIRFRHFQEQKKIKFVAVISLFRNFMVIY